MRLAKLARLAALCCGVTATVAYGQSPYAGAVDGTEVTYGDIGAPMNGYPTMQGYAGEYDSSCDSCDGSCDGGCDAGCGDGAGGILTDGLSCLSCCDRELGDPCRIFGHCHSFSMGGWGQLGYHNKNLSLFNSRKNEVQLQQAWLYAEKALDTSCGGDFGGRIDYVYGTDAPDTQAFGIDNDHWDNSWDNGSDYGHALPQLYFEAGYGDVSVKAGKFFTIIGYEVVAAPQNFFYSHSYTMYNSEPFTHTGVLATIGCCDDLDLYGGWVLGWDSGFEDNGDAYLGGASVTVTEDITLTSTLVAGRFSDNLAAQERGGMLSNVAQLQLNNRLQYVLQNDWLDTEDASGNTYRKTVGINQYLLQTVNDSFSFGARMEWWRVDGDSRGYYGDLAPPNLVIPGNFNVYDLTLGLNYKPCANVVVRPEIRWDWVYGDRSELGSTGVDILEGNAQSQTTFGIDAIVLF